ncbi:MAG: radical SAM/SPASM domain-containing protein, partial [Bacteroidia bacterium]
MSFAENITVLKKLTVKKTANALKVYASYHYSRFTKSNHHIGFPISLNFEPTTSCNLRCPECPSGLRSFTRPTGMLEKKFFQRTIDELKDKLVYLTFYFQGEPYLNPNFLEMVKYASDKNIYTFTSTNAHYLDDVNSRKTIESGLDKLIISIDGTTQEVYEQYRVGGKLDKVLEGTKNIIAWKKKLKSKTPYVVFQFLVVKPNEHQMEEAKRLTKELGADEIKFKTAQINDFENGNPLIPDNVEYSRYKKKADGTYTIKNKLLNQCWRMWSGCVITWDGKVVPCCFDKDAQHRLGDVQQTSFKEIWESSAYNSFRSSILKSRKE